MISEVENLETSIINPNKKHYRWFTYCNKGNSVWVYHWKVDHREWKENQSKNKSVQFYDYVNNAVIYCSYLMDTGEKYVKY